MKEALERVKVAEFGGYAAGPCIGKCLANFGTRVIHVESKQRPDGFRLQYPPYKDDKPIPLTMCFGVPPACTLVAGGGFDYVILPKGCDEVGVAGAIQGRPVTIVK